MSTKKTPAVHYLGHDRSKGYPSWTRPTCNTTARVPVTTTVVDEVTCGVCQTQIWHLRHNMRVSLKGYGRPAIGAAIAMVAASKIRMEK